jgi:hypothetical protein
MGRFSNSREANRFISKDLKDVLRWLLVSTALWEYYRNLDNKHGEEVSLAMHTNLVCSRALFEFFICTGSNDAHIADLNIPNPYTSRRYKNSSPPRPNAWREPMNRHVSHISIGRAGTIQGKHGPTNVIGKHHLKNMMPKFRDEILRLWHKLENDPNLPHDYKIRIVKARTEAEDDCKNALDRFN